MPLNLSQFNVMEHLWETLDKTADGQHIRYTIVDLEQLWWMGFVDTQNYSMEAWCSIFEPYKQPDGSYQLTRDEFLSLDKYRYKGEIKIPFDPMLINEGRYTDDGLNELVQLSIAPSCNLTANQLKDFFDLLKNDFRESDGLILIREPAKQRIRALLEEHSSPLRNLEILLDQMFQEKGKELEGKVSQAESDEAIMRAALQASRFSSAPTSKLEENAEALKALEKKKHRQEQSEIEGVKNIELKKIRRSRKGMRG